MALPLSTARSTMYGKKKPAKKAAKGKAPAKGAKKGAKKPAAAGTKKVPAFMKKRSKK